MSLRSRVGNFFRTFEGSLAETVAHGRMSGALLKDFSERLLLLQGRSLARAGEQSSRIRDLSDVEFRVFSQWGEDGIIDWLVGKIALPNHRFIEFGVENFAEANCRFLLQNRNWRGLVFDGSESNMRALRNERLFWMHDLTAQARFITAENINSLIKDAGFAGPLGILSIDIDGNDYWVWKSIDCVDPAIVICEYNPILGDTLPIVVPYAPDFQRLKAHHSGLYFGASIEALKRLAAQKGYTFVGTNSNGINAFFVRNDLAEPVVASLGRIRAFPSRHRDSRDLNGELTFVGGTDRLKLIADRPALNVETGQTLLLGEAPPLYSEDWLSGMR